MKNILIALIILFNTGLLVAQSDDAKRAYNKGLTYYNLENFSDAIPYLNEAINHFDDFEAAHQLIAICYDETDDSESAISHYEQVIRINPKNKRAMFNLAKQYQRTRDYKNARSALRQALIVDPNYVKAKTELQEMDRIEQGKLRDEDPSYYKANNLFKQKQYNEAVTLLVPLNVQKPTPNSLYLEGLCQEKLGDLNEAATKYQGATVLDSTYIDGYLRMGIIRYNQQNYEEAATHFSDVIRLEEKPSEEYSYYLGNCLYRLEKYEEATNQLNNAVILDPNSGRAHYTLYKVYEQSGSEDKSIIHRIRAEELGYEGKFEDKSKTVKPSVNTTYEETTESVITRTGVGIKGIEKEPFKEEEPKLSKKEQKKADKIAKLEQKTKDKANKNLRKKQTKNPTYRD